MRNLPALSLAVLLGLASIALAPIALAAPQDAPSKEKVKATVDALRDAFRGKSEEDQIEAVRAAGAVDAPKVVAQLAKGMRGLRL